MLKAPGSNENKLQNSVGKFTNVTTSWNGYVIQWIFTRESVFFEIMYNNVTDVTIL